MMTIRNNDLVTVNYIGAAERNTSLTINDDGVHIHAGCFRGGVKEFRAQVAASYQPYYAGKRSHGTTVQFDNCGGDKKRLAKYRVEYLALADFVEKLQRIWCKGKRSNGPKKKTRGGRKK